MNEFALKHVAKERAIAADVPVLSGSPVVVTAAGIVAAIPPCVSGRCCVQNQAAHLCHNLGVPAL